MARLNSKSAGGFEGVWRGRALPGELLHSHGRAEQDPEYNSGMTRRRVITGLLFLLAGLFVNVAVAWGLAIWAETSGIHLDDAQASSGFVRDGNLTWSVSTYRRPGNTYCLRLGV